jgi:hypothetical protein
MKIIDYFRDANYARFKDEIIGYVFLEFWNVVFVESSRTNNEES